MNGKRFPGSGCHPMYGHNPHPHPHHCHPTPPQAHGFCGSCSHPAHLCVCHRHCRKIDKELLVQPVEARNKAQDIDEATRLKLLEQGIRTVDSDIAMAPAKLNALMMLSQPIEDEDKETTEATKLLINNAQIKKLQMAVAQKPSLTGMKRTVIGGSCCVHLSIEYMPLTPLVDLLAFSGVLVMDSESNVLAWGKYFKEDGYHIKEGIISTKPGAHLFVASLNSVTRVRWCEIISG